MFNFMPFPMPGMPQMPPMQGPQGMPQMPPMQGPQDMPQMQGMPPVPPMPTMQGFNMFMMMNQMGTQMMMQFMDFSMKQMSSQMNMMCQLMNKAPMANAPQQAPQPGQPQQKNTFSMGGFNFSPSDLQKLMKLEATPDQLNLLQKGMDRIFDSYTKRKSGE